MGGLRSPSTAAAEPCRPILPQSRPVVYRVIRRWPVPALRCALGRRITEARRTRGLSLQRAAAEAGVSLRTARGWERRDAQTGLPPPLAEAQQCPEGLHFLHTQCTAALYLLDVRAGVGLAMIRQFFICAGLHTLVAVSETTLRRQRRTMLGVIAHWGDTERKRLAPQMQPKSVVVAGDETFHVGSMIVAMHPASGFIFLEERVAQRDAATWTTALRNALLPWPITVVALLGDEAKGLIGCAIRGLWIVKTSDLFHVQQTISRGIAAPMGAMIRVAETKIEDSREAVRSIERQRARAAQHPRDTDDAQAMAAQVVVAAQAVVTAQQELETLHAHGAAIRAAARVRRPLPPGRSRHRRDARADACGGAADAGF